MHLWQRLSLMLWRPWSLRRQSERRVDELFGAVALVDRLNQYARAIAVAAFLVAIIPSLLVPWVLPLDVNGTIAKSDLVAILASSWGVTGGLFALIAAITAVLLNLATDIANRSRLIREYRRRGFDAVAFMSLFVLVWAGWVVLNIAALQA